MQWASSRGWMWLRASVCDLPHRVAPAGAGGWRLRLRLRASLRLRRFYVTTVWFEARGTWISKRASNGPAPLLPRVSLGNGCRARLSLRLRKGVARGFLATRPASC